MPDTRDSSMGTILTAFLAGAAVGAVVVALTTPKRGEELREDLADLLDRLRNHLVGTEEAKPSPDAKP
jgi:gas vesicle protein